MNKRLDADHEALVSDTSERRECAMCGGETKRTEHARYFSWLGKRRLIEEWTCPDCGLQGNILRRLSDGKVVRLSHIHTGSGFSYPLHDVEEMATGGQKLTLKAET